MKHAICTVLTLFFGAFLASAQQSGLSLSTVVIDAGHGGKDAGAVSKDKSTYEKDLTLDIAKRFAACIEEGLPEVKVVLTRSTDVFVELRERAAIANRENANLFISIHINSNTGTTANGYSVHILGQSSQKNRDLFAYNMDIVKRENSVIFLEDDYKTNYQGFDPSDPESYIFMQLMQNAYLEQSLLFASTVSEKLKGGPIRVDRGISQDPFFVLWKTAMPAVLIELGFISNSTDLNALRKPENRQKIAESLFEAFKSYKVLYDSSLNIGKPAEEAAAKPKAEPSAPKAQEPAEAAAPAARLYGTQIFATSRQMDPSDKSFMGWQPTVIKIGSLYKYIIGVSESPDKALENNKAIKEKYPGSFMVEIENGQTTRWNGK